MKTLLFPSSFILSASYPLIGNFVYAVYRTIFLFNVRMRGMMNDF